MAQKLRPQAETLSGSPQPNFVGYQPAPVLAKRAPTAQDTGYALGQEWIDKIGDDFFILTDVSAGVATWVLGGTNTGPLNTLTGDSGGAISPSAGNINVLGTASQITTTGSGSSITASLPAAIIAPGSLTTTTSLAVGTSATVGTTLGVTGATTLAALTQVGTANINASGAGVTTIGTGGTGAVNIGNTTGNTAITGGATVSTTLGVTGLSTLGALTQVGTASINGSGAGITTIGTGGTGATNIGNATGNTAVTGSLTASTSLTATAGAITATNGNLVLGTAGNKILSTSVGTTTAAGANSFGTVTLTGGTATVATTAITTNSIVFLTRQTIGATGAAALGQLSRGTIVNGTSFVINALLTADATNLATTDVSNVGWMIVN